jgi:hypothetical protein
VDSGNGFGTHVFWTAVIPDADVTVNPGAGKAEMHIRDLPVLDYYSPEGTGDLASLGPTWQSGYFAATVSIDVVWSGPVTRRVSVKDAADGFAGTFAENQATVTWSATSDSGFNFVSDVGSFATSVPETPGVNGVTAPLNFFAEVGQERNGIFFPAGSQTLDNHRTDSLNLTARPEEAASSISASDLVHALLATIPATAVAGPASLADHGREWLGDSHVIPSQPAQRNVSSDQPDAQVSLAQPHDLAIAGGFADAFSTPEGYLWAM